METQELLKHLITIPSPFPQEKTVSEFLYDYLQSLGFSVKKVRSGKERYNLVAVYGKAKNYLGLYGHMDTVSPEPYQKNPYSLSVKGNIAKGLGVEDMKGGITAMLQAGEYAVKHNLPVKLIFGVDEENISQGAHDLVDSGLLNDISFLIVGESGQIQNHNQAFSVCYGRKGRILFEAEIIGRKAHAAESEKAINAIEQATHFVRLLQQMKFIKHPHLGKTRIVIHALHSETDSFSVPDKATILFSLLTTPNIASKTFIRLIKQRAIEKNISLSLHPFERKTPYGESYEVDKGDSFLKKIETKILKTYKVKPIYASSVADENVFAKRLNISVISLGPIGGGGHTVNEWLDLRSLKTVENVYKQIIELYNKS